MNSNDNNRESGGNSFKDYKDRKAKYQDRDKKSDFKGGKKGGYRNDRDKAPLEDYIVGINPVLEAIEGNRTINKIMISKEKRTKQIHEIVVKAKEHRIVIQEVDKGKIESVAGGTNHQGVAAYVSPYPYYELDDEIENFTENTIVVALDNLTDVHNFGSILRTCDAVGADYVIIPNRRSVQVNATVGKTSAGAVEHVKVIKTNSLGNAIQKLKDNGFWVIGADMDGEQTYYEATYKGKTVLVAGSEGEGMSKHIKRLCDFVVSIPMVGKVNSLNVSVATSLLLYEWRRQQDVQNK
ncbi:MULTISPECIES: 23S rRNA (guanosine(2251)-2'-O)-methyltransferase RlmB [unclassified Fusibacter]|uniref:23S rRNA (guanosine(2251)-2'-O)-methyltransferase RlmB n=1 Tax=unclassified Fusibacter TaxID=2624464 RepID=UPI001011E535|nr:MULTISPECIES: 23S rRNA (guanosine(2251)-2'-O)-methyltransferase RlmB [unclassified Fusibacter]MCK8059556.1 23S rRNA (guanosine(2251)-2'-O)-methyltransferase RlmB [Fusibacter sp. A2]NPE21357.1 23S rRNA (guanosine(2251)-2'-O)-methyltransferase RlmB [Fusibacter sp. A1]RXV61774.1 23S rRNA (guanosine(2251)-2'-O)-methyltransferase RlmB [Fusibacter sp. A1]